MNGSIPPWLFGRSSVRRAVLAHLLGHEGSAVHASQLARLLGNPPQVVARELRRLEAAGVVVSEAVGRARRYSVNRESPLYPELRGLVSKTVGVQAVLEEALHGLADVEEAIVFGSVARGEERPDSDVDLLIVGEPDRNELADRLALAEQRLGRDVNAVTYAREELERLLEKSDPFVRALMDGPAVRLRVA